jgi:prepilin-type N-terminal cleavage/methylation domain-containing protein
MRNRFYKPGAKFSEKSPQPRQGLPLLALRAQLSNQAFVRYGFTLAEVTVALVILAGVLTLVAQLGIQSLNERSRASAHLAAQELAANTLESARACPWDQLTPAWGANQHLPEIYSKQGWQLKVAIEMEPSGSQVKRVTVDVHWLTPEGKPTRPVQLVEWFSARSAPVQGKKP